MTGGTQHTYPNSWLPPVVFLLSFIVFYFAAMPLMDDPDVPWHLGAGRLLLETHTLPNTDPWSFASNGAPWYLLSWLWDAVLALIEKPFGLHGVFLFTCGLFAGLMTAITIHISRMPIAIDAVLLTIMLATLCMVEFVSARPHLAGYVIILAFVQVLHKSRLTSCYGSLWALPILMLIWANSHGSFIVGFTILGAYGLEAIATRNYVWLKRLLIISFASVIAALLNPYSMEILTGAMQSIDSDLREYIIEWKPFTFGTSLGLSVWLIVFLLASNMRNSEVPLADKILSVMWLIAMLVIMRNGAIFVLLSAPYLASCLDVQTRGLREETKPTAFGLLLAEQPQSRLWIMCLPLVVLFSAYVSLAPHQQKLRSDARSIVDVIDYIKANEPNRKYLSDFDFGGQIIYYAPNQIQFFMDSRSNTAYASQEMKNYLDFLLLKPGWEKKIKAYGVNGIIAHNASAFARAHAGGRYHDRWHLVFAGKAASVYIAAP